MITFEDKGSFKGLEEFLKRNSKGEVFAKLEQYAQEGVAALAAATPTDSGLTAASWTYEVQRKVGRYSIIFKNTHVVSGVNVAILIQYGHGTGTGGYVEGYDYINPIIIPLFQRIADDVWKEVTR